MTVTLSALCIDAADPDVLASFWAGVLGWRPDADSSWGAVLLPTDDTGFRLRFVASDIPRTGRNLVHIDLTSQSPEHQRETVAGALAAGAEHCDVGQGPDADHEVLADPEGNEFCVLPAGNRFLAECGFLGALAGDGTREVACFWSAALGWPLVWDQDQETAIRSPDGGPKLTWGGPPLMPRHGRSRVRWELLQPGGSARDAEVDRLTGLGATVLGSRPGPADAVALADPDGNEFCVRTHQ